MKTILFSALSIFMLVSCSSSTQSTHVLITGQVKNATAKGGLISGIDFTHQVNLDQAGHFSDTIEIAEGYYTFQLGHRKIKLFLAPGDDLNLSFDMHKFNQTMTFEGSAAPNNKYLFTKGRANQKLQNKNHVFFQMDEDSFKAESLKKRDQLAQIIDTSSGLSSSLITKERRDLEYYHLNNISSYQKSYAYYSKNEDFKVSNNFLVELKDLDYYNDDQYTNYPTYRVMAKDQFSTLFNEDYKKNNSYGQSFINTANKLPAGRVRDEMMMEYMPYVLKPNETMTEVYDFFQSASTNPTHKSKITEQYTSIKNLAKGLRSPNFNYENINGGRTTLNELKGKYVYIDIWATWCGPCKKEIPYLKELEEEYKDKNIAFVSISVDKPSKHDAWAKMVKDKEMGGYQLITENATNSDFIRYFRVNGIPHFILLDPEGNIYSAYASRASNPNTRTLLDKLLI